MVLPLPMFHPWRKISEFTIVSIVSQPHFRPNQKNLSIVDDHPTVIDNVLVHDGPSFV